MTAPSSEKNSRRGTPVAVRPPPKTASRGKNARFLSKAVKEEIAREEAAAAEAAAEAVDEEEDMKVDEEEREDPLLVKDEDGNVRKREIITCTSFSLSLLFSIDPQQGSRPTHTLLSSRPRNTATSPASPRAIRTQRQSCGTTISRCIMSFGSS